MRRSLCLFLFFTGMFSSACRPPIKSKITIGSKFFTEQVILAELLAQHIEAKTGIPVERETNLGGTLLVHKALEAGQLDLYVEYTGTALTAVLNESPQGDSNAVYHRVKQLYSERFHFEVTEPDGFRGWSDRYNLHFAGTPKVMDLGLIYRALVDHQVDIVAGNSTDGLIDSLGLVALEDDRQYFPPYAAAVVRAFRQSRGL